MRKFDWNNIQASSDGGFEPLPAGGYVVKVVDMIDNENKENVELIYDIAEGKHAGYYDDDFGRKNTFTHRIYLSYRTEGGLRMTKGRLQCIQKSNPGFDPFAAWDAGRLDMFKGRLFGVNLQEEEYENKNGEVKTKLEVCQVIDAQTVRDGKVRVREKKTLDKTTASSGVGGGTVVTNDDLDIPFN